jgi:hypothetical protein
VERGTDLGTYKFGGSTCIVVFQKDTIEVGLYQSNGKQTSLTTQLVKHGPPPQELCFFERSRSLEKLPLEIVMARDRDRDETKLLGGWPMFYQLCRILITITGKSPTRDSRPQWEYLAKKNVF